MAAAKPNLRLEAFLGRRRDPSSGELIPRPERKASAAPRPRSKTVAASRHGKTLAETSEMIESGEWDGFQARHVVALYDLMHEKCYGVRPEMTSKDRYNAVLGVGAFVKRSFEGDYVEAVEYFRWLWDREIGREKWCRENGKERHKRMGLWLTLNASMLTDYRVAMARTTDAD